MRKVIAITGLLSMFGFAKASEYSEGQVWAYETRPGEEKSTVLINKVEAHAQLGRIFHISIREVRVKNRHTEGGITTDLPHFPVSEETLTKSVTTLVGKQPPNPDYVQGYKTWKEAFDAGKAGVFTISVSEIVSIIEEAINI